MKKILTFFTILFFLLSINHILAAVCTVRDNGCNVGEAVVFSVWKESNSHAGDPNYYDKKICCADVISSYIRTTCNSDETEVLDFYNANNTHVAKKAFTNNKICTKFSEYLNCAIKDSCTSSETCVASIAYETNSHVGDCNYYSHNICCGSLAINVEAGGPYVKTDSLPTILIAGNVTFGRESAPSANVSISIYEGTTLKASKETIASSSGKFFTTFTDLDVGTYTVNVSANYSLTNASTSDTFKVIQRLTGCTQKTVSLNGVALDYLTGSSISSGTVKITIKENGDEFSTTFTNGRWTIAFVSCLVSNDRYIATVQITDSSTGRTSWGEMQFIAP